MDIHQLLQNVLLYKQQVVLTFIYSQLGQGNIIGNPIEPVIKLTANPLTAKTMSEHIDVDVSKIYLEK